MKFKLFDVNFKLPDNYEKSSGNRVILTESENGDSSEITLDNSKEPTIKSSDGSVVFKGSDTNISLDDFITSISTFEKYSMGSYEFTFLVRKFVNSKMVCRALKNEVGKYSNIIFDNDVDGYRADKSDGRHVLCYVQNQSLVIITTNDLENIDNVSQPDTNTWGIIKLAFGAFLILFVIFAIFARGVDRRVIFLIAIGFYFLYSGKTQIGSKKNNCPKFQI